MNSEFALKGKYDLIESDQISRIPPFTESYDS